MKNNRHIDQIENEFVKAHRERREIEPGEYWGQRVMARIQDEAPLRDRATGNAVIQRFVWRFASTAGICALLLALFAFRMGIGPEQLVAKFILDDPLDATAIRALAL